MESVLRLACRLNFTRELDALWDLITAEAPALFLAESANLFLLSGDNAWLEAKPCAGGAERIRLSSAQGIAGAAARMDRAEVINSPHSDSRFYQGMDECAGHRARNLLVMPLKIPDGTTVGVLEILNKKCGDFDSADLKLAEHLSAQAAVAIHTAGIIGAAVKANARLERENRNLLGEIGSRLPGRTIVGSHPKIENLRRLIERVATSDAPALITGETGTGKDLVARTLHFASERAGAAFVAMNCAALPEAWLEAELFGMDKEVKTGVDKRPGKFEAANGGTLFLDEVGDLSLVAQEKILRILRDRRVERVGSGAAVPVDVRLVASTNKNLDVMMGRGLFRQDLYKQLGVVRLEAPALREIASDIPAIALMLVDRVAHEMQRPAPEFQPDALALLSAFRWPGNVRQLENEMRRAVALSRGGQIKVADLSAEVRGILPAATERQVKRERHSLVEEVEQLEQDRIREALARCRYNQLRTAKDLGLSRQGLLNKMKRYGIAAKPEGGYGV